jgi:N-acetylmuramic acid 6-phosphate etherase
VVGALTYARQKVGAATIAICCSPENAAISRQGRYRNLCALVGPEVITGSTRMKAGTAEKMLLNMLSTGAMVKLGKVYGNLMVDVKCANEKLQERAVQIVMAVAECKRDKAVPRL